MISYSYALLTKASSVVLKLLLNLSVASFPRARSFDFFPLNVQNGTRLDIEWCLREGQECIFNVAGRAGS